MRTTVDIAEDVLYAAKEIARKEKKSLGEVLSEYCRSALLAGRLPASPSPSQTGASSDQKQLQVSERIAQYGIEPLPSRGGLISNELIDRLREAEGV